MKSFLRYALVALALCLLPVNAQAATCFWVGGTGNWDSVNTTSWASGTGGTPGTCAATGGIPKNAGDIATFDASSGGGTVTVCGTSTANCPSGSGSLNLGSTGQIICGAFTGTLDFATRNPNVTTGSFSGTGTGTRTINLGSGTWTIAKGAGSAAWTLATTTGLTFNAGSSTLNFTGTGGYAFASGGQTYNIVNFGPDSAGGAVSYSGTSATIATLGIIAPINILFPSTAIGLTVTNAPTWTGTSANPIFMEQGSFGTGGSPVATFTIGSGTPSVAWAVFRGIVFTGGTTGTATNSLSLGSNNSGITITPPSGGGAAGSHCIGC